MKLNDLLESYKKRMKHLGYNQKKLAEIMGVTPITITNILKGNGVSIPKLRLLEEVLYGNEEVQEVLKPTYKERIENLGKSQSFFAKELGMTKQQFSLKISKPKYERENFEKLDLALEVYENETNN